MNQVIIGILVNISSALICTVGKTIYRKIKSGILDQEKLHYLILKVIFGVELLTLEFLLIFRSRFEENTVALVLHLVGVLFSSFTVAYLFFSTFSLLEVKKSSQRPED